MNYTDSVFNGVCVYSFLKANMKSFATKKYRALSVLLFVLLMVVISCGHSIAAEVVEARAHDSILLSWDMWSLILGGLKTTLIIFVFAATEALLLSSLLTYFAISGKCQWLFKPLYWFVRTIRDVPAVALMMMFYYVIFGGELNGIIVTIIASGLYSTGAIVDIFISDIKRVSKGQIEAGRALGMTTRQCYQYIVLPQAVKAMTPFVIGQIKVQLRITSYAGYISQTDLIRAVFDVESIYSDMLTPLLIASLFYLIITRIIVRVITFLTEKLFNYD